MNRYNISSICFLIVLIDLSMLYIKCSTIDYILCTMICRVMQTLYIVSLFFVYCESFCIVNVHATGPSNTNRFTQFASVRTCFSLLTLCTNRNTADQLKTHWRSEFSLADFLTNWYVGYCPFQTHIDNMSI